MKSNFKFIDPDQLDNWHRISSSFGIIGESLRDAVFEMAHLADGASEFFRGNYEFPPFYGDGFVLLAWHNEYHTTDDDGLITRSRPIVEEVAQIVAVLGEMNPADFCPITYYSKILCASDKSLLQGLAVETMLLADGCINLLLGAKAVAALPWLSAAYQGIMNCARRAQEILDSANVSRARVSQLP